MSNLFGNIVKIEGDPEVVAQEWPKLRQRVWEALCASPDRDVHTPAEPHDFEDLPRIGNAVRFWTLGRPLEFYLPTIMGAKVSHEWRDESDDVDFDRDPDEKGRVAQIWSGVYIDRLFVDAAVPEGTEEQKEAWREKKLTAVTQSEGKALAETFGAKDAAKNELQVGVAPDFEHAYEEKEEA